MLCSILRTGMLCALLISSGPRELRGQGEGEHERSGLWVRAGLDFGSLRVDSLHEGALGGVRFRAGWTLSPDVTAGLRTAFYPDGTGPEATTSWLVGPEVFWYPLEGPGGLALGGGVSLLDFQERSELVTPDVPDQVTERRQTFRGLVGHLTATASMPIGEYALFEIGLEVGYAPGGVWRDSAARPVTGRPRSVVVTLGFGID